MFQPCVSGGESSTTRARVPGGTTAIGRRWCSEPCIAARVLVASNTMETRDKPTDSGFPASEILALYRRAFAEFGARALWNIKEFDEPTVPQMLAITRQLRTEGDLNARRLAEQIERAAGAHL